MNEFEQDEYVIEPTVKSRLFDWRELWDYRELFYFFTWRDIKVKYKQTTLGILWVVLQPLFTVGIFSLFFGYALKVPSNNLPYPIFAFSGLLLWNFFSSSVNSAGNSMSTQAPIIKKIFFPRIIIPVSSVLVAFVDLALAFVIFIAVVLIYKVDIDFVTLSYCWPLAIMSLVAGTLGISCWLAALTVKYRDFRYVIPFALQVLLFVSPVIYPVSILKISWINHAMALNPVYGAINLFRAPFFNGVDDINLILISLGSTLFFLFFGIFYFRKTETFFADLA